MTATAPWVIYGRGAGARWVAAATVPTVPSKRPVPRVKRSDPRPFALEVLERAMRSDSTDETASLLGVSTKTIQRIRRDGLCIYRADHYATLAGVHPGEVWPDWWDD